MAKRTCSLDDCGRRHYGKGYCQMHYQRDRTHGNPLMGAAVRNPVECVADGCNRSPKAKGLCPKHWERMRNYGCLEPTFRIPRPRSRRVGVEPCEIEGCEKPIKARGWCVAHWTRWQRKGSPTARLHAEVVDGKRICASCKTDVPLVDWYITPKGRPISCRDCFGEWNRDRGHRRRAVTSGERFTRREILERDGWVCQLCDVAIDPALNHPHPMSATLDHIVPIARGGEHSRDNAQSAHRICNMRKWAHVGEVA